MVKIIGPLGSHDASGHLLAPRIYSSSLRNRHDRQAPPAPPPPSGGSLLFINTNDHCNAATINHTNQYPGTLEAWFRPTTTNGLLAGTFFGTDVAGVSIVLTPTHFRTLAAFNNKYYPTQQNQTLPLATWAHLALTWDTGLITMWENGIKGAEYNGFDFSLSHHSGFYIGGQVNPTYPKLDGHITRVRFSDTIRYAANFTPATDFTPDGNTIGLWRMTEGSGTTVADESGNGHTLEFPAANKPTWSDQVP